MIPKPSGIILINVGSGDSKNGNICTRGKSIHLRADFSYRETKILCREKKYLFAGGFAVPGELMKYQETAKTEIFLSGKKYSFKGRFFVPGNKNTVPGEKYLFKGGFAVP